MEILTDKGFRARQLDLLKKFHDFCGKHDLRYSLTGGTLLGACRHNGFIPWDDDMDVMMPRPDYDKFASLAKSDLVPFAFYDFHNSRNIMFMFAKCVDPHACYKRDNQSNAHEEVSTGVFLDVFPYDGLPSNKFMAKLFAVSMFAIRTMLSNKQMDLDYYRKYLKPRFGIKKRIAVRLQHAIGKLFPLFPSYRVLEWIFRKFQYDKSRYVTDYTAGPTYHNLFIKDWFKHVSLHKFETENFFVIDGYDEWLTMFYGDWRTPPPESERMVHQHLIDGKMCYDENLFMMFSR